MKNLLIVTASLSIITALGLAGCDRNAPQETSSEKSKQVEIKTFGMAGVFTDHMVLQRGEPITVWGVASKGTDLKINFDGEERTATADDVNAWRVEFPAKTEAGPFEISVSGDGKKETITDILVGDVFLCSGQSNMEMKVKDVFKARGEMKRNHNPTIRQFHPRYKVSPAPLREFHNPQQWVVATSDTVGEFSGACYFFVKELQKTNPVPIGMLHSSWGGSQIQSWMRQEDLRPFEGMNDSMDVLNTYAEDKTAGMAALGAQWEKWYAKSSGGSAPWTIDPTSETDWAPVPGFKNWKNYGDKTLARHDGLVWYRNTLTLTEKQAAKGADINLGKLSKGDIVWVNGKFLGRSVGWNPRTYHIDDKLLNSGVNHVLVNVRSMWGAGGMMGPVEEIGFTPDGGEMVPMSEGWEYKKVPDTTRMAPLIPWGTMSGYTGMHNAMIAPLDGLKFKGAVWYQGESNTRRDEEYDEMLAVMIKNWRDTFGANMPVVIVQLPDFGDIPTEPAESTWSNLREAQRIAALRDPNIGLAVTMGLGNAADIHPTNKQGVGKRISEIYRGLIGETNADTLGFSPKRTYRRGDTVRVEMAASKGGYVTRSDNHPIAFQLCENPDPNTQIQQGEALNCAYATATMEHSTVVLTSGKISTPSHVRYCWGMAPTCNLFTAKGQPVGPFQMAIE